MNLLRFARLRKDIRGVVQTLRERGFRVNGPYRRRNATFVYCLDDFVVTERELLDLANAGKLDAAGVAELTSKIKKNGS
jgi:hypothetical protein